MQDKRDATPMGEASPALPRAQSQHDILGAVRVFAPCRQIAACPNDIRGPRAATQSRRRRGVARERVIRARATVLTPSRPENETAGNERD
jgi:hypothetical protein